MRQPLAYAVGLTVALASATAWAQQGRFPLPPSAWGPPVHDNPLIPFLLVDRLEYRAQKGADARVWDVQGSIGGDYNKLWIKSEGEKTVGGQTAEADLQALYARLISPFWYLQAGVRAQTRPTPSRNSLVLGVQGIAPYWFDVEASAFFAEGGKLSARLEAEYDFLLTQRLILQPRVETGFAASSDAERGVGRGFNDVEFGLRLRYEFTRQFAPYIGVNWSRKVGDTADLARRRGEDVKEYGVVVGLRAWY